MNLVSFPHRRFDLSNWGVKIEADSLSFHLFPDNTNCLMIRCGEGIFAILLNMTDWISHLPILAVEYILSQFRNYTKICLSAMGMLRNFSSYLLISLYNSRILHRYPKIHLCVWKMMLIPLRMPISRLAIEKNDVYKH